MLQICLGYGALCWPLGFTTQELRDLHWIRTQPGPLFHVLWGKRQTWNTKLALNLQDQNFDLSGAQHCCDFLKKGKDRQGARLGPPASQEYQMHRALVKGESPAWVVLCCAQGHWVLLIPLECCPSPLKAGVSLTSGHRSCSHGCHHHLTLNVSAVSVFRVQL